MESEKQEDPLYAFTPRRALWALGAQSPLSLPGIMQPHHPVMVTLQRRWRALAAGGGSHSGEVAQQGC